MVFAGVSGGPARSRATTCSTSKTRASASTTPSRTPCSEDPSYGTTYIHDALAPFGLGDRWSFVNFDGAYHGASREAVRQFCADADLYINLSGGSWFWRDEYARIPRRVFIDTDPVFTQLRHRQGRRPGHGLLPAVRPPVHVRRQHRHAGLATSRRAASRGTRRGSPRVLDHWRTDTPDGDRFTTVMTWKTGELHRRATATRTASSQRFIDLPSRTARFPVVRQRPQTLQACWLSAGRHKASGPGNRRLLGILQGHLQAGTRPTTSPPADQRPTECCSSPWPSCPGRRSPPPGRHQPGRLQLEKLIDHLNDRRRLRRDCWCATRTRIPTRRVLRLLRWRRPDEPMRSQIELYNAGASRSGSTCC